MRQVKLIFCFVFVLVLFSVVQISAGAIDPDDASDERLVGEIRSGSESTIDPAKLSLNNLQRAVLYDPTILDRENVFEGYESSIRDNIDKLNGYPDLKKFWLKKYGIKAEKFGEGTKIQSFNIREKIIVVKNEKDGRSLSIDIGVLKKIFEKSELSVDGTAHTTELTEDGRLKFREGAVFNSGTVSEYRNGKLYHQGGEVDLTEVDGDLSFSSNGVLLTKNGKYQIDEDGLMNIILNGREVKIKGKDIIEKKHLREYNKLIVDVEQSTNFIFSGSLTVRPDGRRFLSEGSELATFENTKSEIKMPTFGLPKVIEKKERFVEYKVKGETEILTDLRDPVGESFIREIREIGEKPIIKARTNSEIEIERDGTRVILEKDGKFRFGGNVRNTDFPQIVQDLGDGHEMKVSNLGGRSVFAKCSEPCREVGHAFNRLKGQLNGVERTTLINGERKSFRLNIDPETIVTEAYNLEGSDIEVFRTVLPSSGVTETYLTDLSNGDVFYREGNDDFQKYYINEKGRIELIKVTDSPTATPTVKWAMNNEIIASKEGEHSLPQTGYSITPKVDTKIIGKLSDVQFGGYEAGDTLIKNKYSKSINSEIWKYDDKTGNYVQQPPFKIVSITPKEFNKYISSKNNIVEVKPYAYEGFDDSKAGTELKIKDYRGNTVGNIQRNNLFREYNLYDPKGKKIGSYKNLQDAKRSFESKALHEWYLRPKGRK
tara:strand:+ start:744 stop:2885 length:2142 start_codon:yes stop_codon:yes gene_type:complete